MTAFRAVKPLLAAVAATSIDEWLAPERHLQGELGRIGDNREAVKAFLAKRAPAFAGR